MTKMISGGFSAQRWVCLLIILKLMNPITNLRLVFRLVFRSPAVTFENKTAGLPPNLFEPLELSLETLAADDHIEFYKRFIALKSRFFDSVIQIS